MKKHLQRLLLIAALLLPWVTQAQSFSYSCDFDGDSDTAGWVFVNGTQSNKWCIGTATNNSGTKSMYVSNDNGSSTNYTNSATQFSYAYREVTLDAGGYFISYDWKCYGESSYDFLRVFLAPASATLTAGQDPTGGTSAYTFSSSATPTGWISLSGVNKLNMQSTWQNFSTDFTVAVSGTYKLVFCWANDASGGSSPAACIDNLVLYQPTCPRPINLMSSNLGTDHFDMSWTEVGSATEWFIVVDSAGTTVYST